MVAVPEGFGEVIVEGGHLVSQLSPAAGEHGLVFGILREVAGLVGVGLVVEEQFLAVRAVDGVGVAFVTQGAPFVTILPGGAGTGVLEEGEGWLGTLFPSDKVGQIHAFHFGRTLDSGQPQEGGHDIHAVQTGIALAAVGGDAGPFDQERDARGFIVEDVLLHPAVGTEHLPVIGREDEDGVLGEVECRHGGLQSPDVPVQIGGHGVVGALPVLDLLGALLDVGPGIAVGIVVTLAIGGGGREFHISEATVVFGGNVLRGPGIVRGAVGKNQGEGRVPLALLAQEFDGQVCLRVGLEDAFAVVDALGGVGVVVGAGAGVSVG